MCVALLMPVWFCGWGGIRAANVHPDQGSIYIREMRCQIGVDPTPKVISEAVLKPPELEI